MSGDIPESKCDVLIIGAGPAGLMAATWMARCGVRARVVDKRGRKIFAGQADGIQCRSLEILDSFGFADRVWKESMHMMEVCMWNPGENGVIRRSDRVPDTPSNISRFTEVTLHQGRMERFFLDSLKEHSDIEVERGLLPESLEIDESRVQDHEAYPIKVSLRHLTEKEATPAQHGGSAATDGLFRTMAPDDTDDLIRKSQGKEGTTETVRAKYVIGCDGGHSWTRRQLGIEMVGDATDYVWGVLDVIPITNFPDIRKRCLIHSERSGSLMVIPREKKLVRLYIQLQDIVPESDGRADRSKITPDRILEAAKKILEPYSLSYHVLDWWTAYQIGQRVGSSYQAHNRVFLAGDAVHANSPKNGQGQNQAIQDAYNLGWKVALVAKRVCQASILETYQPERRTLALELIEFDKKFASLFSGRPANEVTKEVGVSMEEFNAVFLKGQLFASGLSADYGSSMLVAKSEGDSAGSLAGKQQLATKITLGMRFPSNQVLNQADARPWHFQEWFRSDGRFRIVLFAGNVADKAQKKRMETFCANLDSPESFLRRFTPASQSIDSVIEILTLHSAPRRDVEVMGDFPGLLHPFDEKLGYDYDKIFVDDECYHAGHGHAYRNYSVDAQRGCVVAVRPDQFVGYIGELEDVADLGRYFEGILLPKLDE